MYIFAKNIYLSYTLFNIVSCFSILIRKNSVSEQGNNEMAD